MANESIETEIDLNKVGEKNETIQNVDKPIRTREAQKDELDIQIEDDTPADDRNRPKRAEGTKSAVPSDDEIGQYTKGVQDRLKQMKWEYHEERRAKEAWQREHGAALTYAERMRAENLKMRQMLEQGHKTMLDSNKSAAESEVAALQQSLQAAYEAGDAGKIADLSAKMSKAAARLTTVEQTQPLKFEKDPDDKGDKGQQQERQQQQAPQLTESMQSWMDENPWFNGRSAQDRKMTAYAFGIHDTLVNHEKIRPESPEYFKRINEEMRETFGKYFDDDEDKGNKNDAGNGSQSRQRTVGSASRLNGAGHQADRQPNKNKVTLTTTEVALAKRMRVPLEDFAREKLRLQQSQEQS